MNKLIIYFCILFLLAPLIAAQPPVTQTFVGDVGLTLENPLASFLQVNRDINPHLHVYNSSSGFPMTNATTSCFLDIYNVTGSEILHIYYDYNVAEGEWELDVAGENFSEVGDYGFLIQCNTSQVGGFVRGRVRATADGEDDESIDNTSGLAIVIFILTITGSLFAFSMKKEILKNPYANIIAKRSLLTLGVYLMILNSAIMATLADSSNIPVVQEMFTYMNLFGFMGYPAMLLLMLSALFQALTDWKKNVKAKRTGDEGGE